MIALGMAGYSPNSADLWKVTCASMMKDVCLEYYCCYDDIFQQIKHPYLRAAFSFLSSEDPLHSVLVRVIILCILHCVTRNNSNGHLKAS